ncbi:MAG: GNAT family N-acetyltransferase, partial [Alphaproteobacteria bacterium]|nr:GNAT family N-acetyltransferase [Alphaproteobacteria bacterium]
MGTAAYGIRAMAEDDIGQAHALSQAVRWPHRPEDWRLLRAAGHAIVATDAAGAVVGTGLWWPYGSNVGSLGLVIVAPDRQGAGIGRRLMDAILAAAGERTMLLNATVA